MIFVILTNEILLHVAKVERELYPYGCYVMYLGSDKKHKFLVPGLKGIVRYVDDEANVYVDWENGMRLGLIYGQDYWKRISSLEVFIK